MNNNNLDIPEWKDKDRIMYLFSKLRSKHEHPKQYHDKMEFWRRAIVAAFDGNLLGQSITMAWADTETSMIKRFENFGLSPASLYNVWDEWIVQQQLLRAKELVSKLPIGKDECQLYDPELSDENNTWGNLLVSTLASAVRRVSLLLMDNEPVTSVRDLSRKENGNEPMVFTPVLDRLVEKLKATNDLLTVTDLHSLLQRCFPNLNISLNDAYLLLGYLVFRKKAVVKRSEGSDYLMIKLALAGPLQQISEEEEGEFTLKKTIQKLQAQLDEISIKERKSLQSALEAKRNNQITLAKKYLLTKKTLDSIMEKHVQHIHQLETILLQVSSAKTEAQILQAYDIGSKTLDQVLKKENLNVERVDKTMEYVQEVFDKQKDIDSAMSQWQEDLGPTYDEDELEQELQRLGTEPEPDKISAIEEQLSKIPEIPQNVPVHESEQETELQQTREAIYSNKVILRQNTNTNKWIRYAVAKEQTAGGDISCKMDQIEEPKLKSYTNIKEQLQHMFFPKGYPHSVTNNYYAFFKWNLVTAISGSVTNILATQSLLLSLGMGQSSAIPVAATLNWILKDGLGLLGGVIYTSLLSGKFDSEPKRYRWYASILLQSASLCELITPLFPGSFLLLASMSNIAKNIAWLTLSGTRAQMNQSLCLRDNLADITAKNGSQMTAASLFATGLGIGAGWLVGGSVISSLIFCMPLCAVSLYGVYKSNKAIFTSSINVQRGELILSHMIKNNFTSCPTPEEASNQEVFVFGYKSAFKDKGLSLNSKVSVIPSNELATSISQLQSKNYMIYNDETNNCVHLWFSDAASGPDILSGFYNACKLRLPDDIGKKIPENDELFSMLNSAGWKTQDVALPHSNRLQILN